MTSYKTFGIADYCIFAVTIIVSLGIGVYYAFSGGKQRTTSEFFVGNRGMNFLPVAISLMVSFESSIMMLGIPAEAYVYGIQYLIGNFGFFVCNIIAIFVFVPLIHPLRITSAYEYLELRFKSRMVRTLGTSLGMLSYTAYIGIVLFGPAIALEGVTGFPQWGSIVSVAVASVIYTAIGGLKAVIWTDVFQCAVMFAGFFAVLIKGTMQVGGIQRTWEIAYENGRINLFNFDPDPTIRHTFWCLFVGSIVRGGGLIFNQSSVQRIASIPTIWEAKKVMLLVAPGFFLSLTLASIEGVIAYAFYDVKGCDPLKSKQISNPNQIIPYMVMDIFDSLPGMPGLFMASLFSASLSTLSSGLSSLSALFWTDLIKPHCKPMSEFKATVISKLSVVAFGGLAIFVAFMISMIGGTLIQITGSLLSAFGGPLSGLFLFGCFCPFGNAQGAFWGSIMSTIVTFIICLGQMLTKGSVKNTRLPPAPLDFCPAMNSSSLLDYSNITDNVTMLMSTMTTPSKYDVPEPTGFSRLFMLSYQWFGTVGILQVFIYGTIISYFTGFTKPEDLDKRTVMSFYDTIMPFLPECIKQPLRCGYGEVYKAKKISENGDADFSKDGDVFSANIVIEPPEIIDTKLQTNHFLKDQDLKQNLINTMETGTQQEGQHDTISLSDVLVTTDERGSHHIPIKDMEFEIIKTGNSMEDIGSKSGPMFIVLDKTDEGHLVRFKAKSVEFDIVPEVPEVSITPPTPDESVDATPNSDDLTSGSGETLEPPKDETILEEKVHENSKSKDDGANTTDNQQSSNESRI